MGEAKRRKAALKAAMLPPDPTAEKPDVDPVTIQQVVMRGSVLARCKAAWSYYDEQARVGGVPATKRPSLAAFIGQGLILRGLEAFEAARQEYEDKQKLVKEPTDRERQIILAGGGRG